MLAPYDVPHRFTFAGIWVGASLWRRESLGLEGRAPGKADRGLAGECDLDVAERLSRLAHKPGRGYGREPRSCFRRSYLATLDQHGLVQAQAHLGLARRLVHRPAG